jgi:hypothetical protein
VECCRELGAGEPIASRLIDLAADEDGTLVEKHTATPRERRWDDESPEAA